MSARPLKVLISNDDGPPCHEESPFILPFIEHLESLGWDVKVCLPDSQKSWISKSFMIKEHVEMSYYHRETGERSYHRQAPYDIVLLSATPATCINIALHHIFKDEQFDLVIGGPNFGRNSANIYTLSSGTIGAALEAVMSQKKAIALSFAFFSRDFAKNKIECACQMASNVIQHLYQKDMWPAHGLFNVNVPLVDELRPVRLTHFHTTSYGSLFRPLKDKMISDAATTSDASGEMVEQSVRSEAEGHEPGKTIFHFAPDIKSMSHPADPDSNTDAWALQNRYVSVTPMVAAYQIANMDKDYELDSLHAKI
ncbi:5'/3'-nucleotidase SurE [Lichtheimia ornata]|uniref:5'/3'-nucleotidase SurE n=1 Tax=Lichtheimia ornata TaxID=688661 RepID=A0AAD7Y5H2_9FUNG|nr:5'/3'-nucleotidase SurE [Lichtheimia ornata]KAJ8664091.1 5'/3'-nucleotidase SurE [Lichtheimia ornata]